MSEYAFDIPTHHKSIIKVLGMGGGGSNDVNHMYNLGFKDVEFIVCNTDAQALQSSPVPNKLQLGLHLTEGLGAGANPEVGQGAALESKEDIRNLLSNDTKMVFITAGMGGGTGTGAAPVIASVAKELGILTVGIVTMPFMFEGPKKTKAAREGLEMLKDSCDTVLAIGNDKLRLAFGNLKISQAFAKADDVLATAANSIAEIITNHNHINVDFRDVKSVMQNAGSAVMGSAVASGEGRATRATEDALSSPLLESRDVLGAEKILLTVSYAEEPDLDEFSEVTDLIMERSGGTAEMIFGVGDDTTLSEDEIRVTIIATGFGEDLEQAETKVYSLDKKAPVTRTEEPVAPEVPTQTTVTPLGKVEDEPEAPQATSQQDIASSRYEIIDAEPKKEDEGFFDSQTRKIEQITNDRIKKLEDLKKSYDTEFEDDEMWNVPAYKRRNVQLNDEPHSSESDVSRFTLNDDKDILGNNKFLHDNVD
jgi:cell division protein FtsZ